MSHCLVHAVPSKYLVCPHCKRAVTLHEFVVDGAHLVRTEHCSEHGDVIAIYSAVVNQYPVAPAPVQRSAVA